MNRALNARQIWLISLVVCAAAAVISFKYLDMPIARRLSGNLGELEAVGAGLGSAVLLSLEAAIAITLIAARLVRGHLSPLNKTLALACLTSMCAFAVNDSVLKLFFGIPNPWDVLFEGAHHTFHFLAGSRESSFPSGHMILAGSFGGVFMKLYPGSRWPLSILLFIGAALLIVGDWHFVSDVIAGTFAGVSAGLLAGELWRTHLKEAKTAP